MYYLLIFSCHLIVGATYIPPNVDVGVYERYYYITCDTLDKWCDNLIVVCGDFDLPNTTWSTIDNNMTYDCSNDPKSSCVVNCFSYLNMFQVNKIPNSMNRFLDLVFCNELSVMPSVDHALILNESIFHLACGFQINSCLNNNLKLQSEDVYYDFKYANYEAINYHLCQINWDAVFMFKDVNEALNSFYCVVHNLIQNLVPLKKCRISQFPRWFSQNINPQMIMLII
jgi:hypothetical protein